MQLPKYDGNIPYFQALQIRGRNCYIRSVDRLGHLCGYAEISDEEYYHAPRYRDGEYVSDYSDFDVHGGYNCL
jgi:hypothetical protein